MRNAPDCETPVDLDLPGVTTRAFEYVMRFLYRGSAELETSVVGDVMAAADALSMPELRAECVSFMMGTVGPDNCLRYWSYLESYDVAVDAEQKLYKRCRDVARSTFCRALHSPRPGATDAIVETLLRDDGLMVCCTIYYVLSHSASTTSCLNVDLSPSRDMHIGQSIFAARCYASQRKLSAQPPDTEIVSEWQLFKILDKLPSTAAGMDNLPAWFLRIGAPVFCKPFSLFI